MKLYKIGLLAEVKNCIREHAELVSSYLPHLMIFHSHSNSKSLSPIFSKLEKWTYDVLAWRPRYANPQRVHTKKNSTCHEVQLYFTIPTPPFRTECKLGVLSGSHSPPSSPGSSSLVSVGGIFILLLGECSRRREWQPWQRHRLLLLLPLFGVFRFR